MKLNILLGLISILIPLQIVFGDVEVKEPGQPVVMSNFDDDGIVGDEEEKPTALFETNESTDDIEDFGEYISPIYNSDHIFFGENFDDINLFMKNWIKSNAKKDDIDDAIAKYDGVWEIELPKRSLWKNDLGLVLKSKAKHAAISSKFNRPFIFKNNPFIVQYEVTLQTGQECGGSYIKLLSQAKETEDLTKFNDKTPYTIMFGPDKCGNDIKLHFIFRHVNPINGTISEKHCRKPKKKLEEDKTPHLYRLEINPDNTFKISVDHQIVNEGSLLTSFEPPVNPPREIDDPSDEKPNNWDEREKIPDPDARKPDDWDEEAPPKIPDPDAFKPNGWLDNEPEMISDSRASKPEDWDVNIDGEWEPPLIDNPVCENAVGCGEWSAPLIANPEYKGKWNAPLIENPNYQGKWTPRKIVNPEFYEDLQPFKMSPIVAVGLELWSMSSDILFDNILITDDIHVADEYAAKTFDLKMKHLDKASKTWWGRLMRHMNYKPGWWALYFIYVAIPFGLYIKFLRKAKKHTFLNRFLKYSNENPWLWGVYILVIGTPLSFVFYSLCCVNRKEEDRALAATRTKKTDEVTPGDDEKEIENMEGTPETDLPESKTDSLKSKKSDLEVNSPVGDNIETVLGENNSDAENKNIDEIKLENIGDNIRQMSPDSTRKRRPRKE